MSLLSTVDQKPSTLTSLYLAVVDDCDYGGTYSMGSYLSGAKGPQSFGDRIMLVVVLEMSVLLAQLYVCRAEVVVK